MDSYLSGHSVIKQIPVSDLTQGMFVHDLNCGWLDHPFARSRFLVADSKTLERIHRLPVNAVYIDTRKGLDVVGAPTQQDVQRRQQRAIEALLESDTAPPPDATHRLFDDELPHAASITRDAHRLIGQMMTGIKLGKQVKIDATEAVVERMTQSLLRNPDALLALGRIRCADQYTFEHSINVCTLMVAFGHFLGLHAHTIRALGSGAMLHDIGKVKISDALLNKPGKLTEQEFAIMQTHVQHGAELLAMSAVDPVARAVVAEHHERWDGSGYPRGVHQDQISYYGHMAAIVDVYDALTSDRCYHAAMAPTEALRKIYEWSRYQFHPELAQQFIRFIGVYPSGSFVQLASGRLAIVLDRGEDRLHPRVRLVYDTLRRRMLSATDIDLAQGDDRIEGYADPATWGLDGQQILRQKL